MAPKKKTSKKVKPQPTLVEPQVAEIKVELPKIEKAVMAPKKMSLRQQVNDYYPTYLKAHQHVWNRRLHVLGQFWTVLWLAASVWATATVAWFCFPLILLTPFVIYGIVWPAHRLIEKNKPATWTQPAWLTKACDAKMFVDILTGKIPS